MMEDIKRKPHRLFSLFFWKFLFGYLPFGLLAGVLAFADVYPASFNNEEVGGLAGLVIQLFLIPFFALVITTATWLFFMIGHGFILVFSRIVGRW